MKDFFEDVRAQLHEIRNLVGPIDIKLANLENKFVHQAIFTASLESRLLSNTFKLDAYSSRISEIFEQNLQLLERVKQIELVLRISQ